MQPSLEIVRYTDTGKGFVTVQLALNGILAVPMSVEKSDFAEMNEAGQQEFLARSARTLIDIYGDARDGLVISDGECQARADART